MAGESQQLYQVIEVTGLNFALLAEEEQRIFFEHYQQLIASLSFPLQICARIKPLDLKAYLRFLDLPQGENWNDLEPWERLALSHREMLEANSNDRGLLERRFYLAVPADDVKRSRLSLKKQGAGPKKSVQEAVEQVKLRTDFLVEALESIGLHPTVLEEGALIQVYDSYLGLHRREFPLTQELLETMALDDALSPNAIRVEPGYLAIEEREFVANLAVTALPSAVRPGWLQPLVELHEWMDLTFHQTPRGPEALSILRRKQAQYQSSLLFSQSQGKTSHPLMGLAADRIEPLLDQVALGEERLHDVSFHLLIRGSSKEDLERRVRRVSEAIYAVTHHRPRPMLYEQDRGLKLALPGNVQLTDSFFLDSTSLATLFPCFSNLMFRPSSTAILEGVTPKQEPVVIDVWELPNYNRIIVGPTGDGKSYKQKLDIMRSLVMHMSRARREGRSDLGIQYLVIDPAREQRKVVEALGGQWVQIAPGSGSFINPFDLPLVSKTRRVGVSGKEDILAAVIRQLHLLLDEMLALHSPDNPNATLTFEEKSLLDIALYETYRRYAITSDRTSHGRPAPQLRDLYNVLVSGEIGEDTTNLAQRLRRYVSGSLAGLFSGATNVDLTSHLVVFDTYGLDSELRALILMLITNLVWNVSFGSKIPRMLVIDELLTLYRHRSGRLFIEEMFQNARKNYLGVVGITQDPMILKDSTVLANSATKLLMKQDATTAAQTEALFQLSPQEGKLTRSFKRGEGLMLVDGKRMHLLFPSSSEEHRLASTLPEELARWELEEEEAEVQRASEAAPVVLPQGGSEEGETQGETPTHPRLRKFPRVSLIGETRVPVYEEWVKQQGGDK
jgi:hypothetical protein